MIDTHCHLYSSEFSADVDSVINDAVDKGVTKFYMPAIDSTTTVAMLEVEKNYPGLCMAMMGLHPCSVKENYKDEVKHVEDWLSKRSFASIGEIGLDFYWDKTFIEEQYIVFRDQAELAVHYNLPIVIHSRNATTETIDLIREFSPRGLKGIFHCFGGSVDEAKQIIDNGFYLGIGGIVTYKNAGLAEVLAEINLKSIVLETDAPYLAPVPFRGKRNESSYLKLIADKVAGIKQIPVEEIIAITTANALSIFENDKQD